MLYITRHGQTEWNTKKILQGKKDSPLTEKGIQDAFQLAKRLSQIDFDIIYSSPLPRAVQTSNIINSILKTDIIYLKDLEEMGYGVWEGVEKDILNTEYPLEYENYFNFPEKYIPPKGGESFLDFEDRIKRVLNDIYPNCKDKNVLVITHGVVLKMMINIIKKREIIQLWTPPHATNCALSIIDCSENITILAENDVSHLGE